MASRRVYLPVTAPLLRRARADGHFGPAPLRGHAVTPAVLSELADASEEEREYAALTAAALDALSLLGAGDVARRIVVALDVPVWEPVPGPHASPTAVLVPTTVALDHLAAVQVDAADAEPDVVAARDSSAEDSEERIERCLDHELGWYAAQELDQLLAELYRR